MIYNNSIFVEDYDYLKDLLAENGIYLYEDGILFEGQQAEEYKARKAKEKEDKENKENERNSRRYANAEGVKDTDEDNKYNKLERLRNDGNKKKEIAKILNNMHNDDLRRSMALRKVDNAGLYYDRKDRDQTMDAVDRHMRRNPKQYPDAHSWDYHKYNESYIFDDIDLI